MLCLSRKVGQKIRIGREMSLTVLSVTPSMVRLGFTGPRGVAVMREELLSVMAAGVPLWQIEEQLDWAENQQPTP